MNNINKICRLVEDVLSRHHDRGPSETRFSAVGQSEIKGTTSPEVSIEPLDLLGCLIGCQLLADLSLA
jgi:hypothetical protein